VFVQEQGGPLEDEPDAYDPTARHFVMVQADEVIGAARIYQPEAALTKIGRVCLLPEHRGRGLGELLMRELLRYAASHHAARVVLDAQCYAIPFYERLGFQVVGEEFLDAGIAHRRMELSPTRNAP
jgi:predicted GNAT family N-acyltransferase